MKNNINNISYIAGYIDGDGCLYAGKFIQKGTTVTVYEQSIQVVSVKIKSLEFFKEVFDGNIRKKPIKLNHRDAYCWTIKGKASAKVAAKIFPFIKDKRAQCDLFIKLATTIVPNNGKVVSDDIIQYRNELMNHIREEKHMKDFVTKEKIDALDSIDSIQAEPLDYPYLAGIIDSEGCFRIKKWKPKNKPNYVFAITLEIGNTRIPIFEFLIERFGGNITFVAAKGLKKASAIWSISSFALSQLIPKILPFLIIKQEAAIKVMEFYSTNLPNGGDRHSAQFKALYAEKLILRERIVDEIHALNLKGLKVESSSL